MSSRPFVLLDVFAERPLAGNQLVVLPDAAGLDEQAMLAIAREFNYSETTFVVPPRDPRAMRRLRCFSPTSEVFGAGHNALGAWWALVAGGHVPASDGVSRLWQELGDRILPVDVFHENGALVRVAMIQGSPQVRSGEASRDRLASALGLDSAAFRVPGIEPKVVSTGATHWLVPVRTLDDLARVRADADLLTKLAKPLGCEGCYLFCLETRGPGALAHARGFFPGIGIAEDPATGSAAGPLAYYLASLGRVAQGEWVAIEQGYEIHRPSRIEARIRGDVVEVAGRCAIVAEGSLRL